MSKSNFKKHLACQFTKKYRASKNTKFNKNKRFYSKNHRLSYCIYGLQALSTKPITAKQIEAINRKLAKIKHTAHIIIRLHACTPVSKKALGQRMGGGKSSIDRYVDRVKAGQIIAEFNTYAGNIYNIVKVFNECLPMKTKLRKRLL